MAIDLRNTGIAAVGDMPWGTHFCHFYQTPQDLLDTVVPYLKAGLANNEACMWVTAGPLSQKTREALRHAIPGVDKHVAKGDIQILPYTQWYLTKDRVFDPRRVVAGWEEQLARALDQGYAGLRAAADEAWLGKKYWQAFADYEQELDEPISRQRMLVMCAYPLASSNAGAIFDVARTHQFATAERNGCWQTLETPELKHAKAQLKRLNEDLELRVAVRTRELEEANKALARDITERLQAEEALRQSQQFLQAIIDNTTAVVYVKDLQGRFLLINRRYEELFHITREAAVGRTDFDVFPPEQAEAFRVFDRRVLEAGTALEAEELASQDDGNHTYISVKYPLLDAAGRPYAICGISTDITERKRGEAERQAREAAEAATRAKSEFLARMSHELRSPLNTVLGFSRLMTREPELPSGARENLDLILKSGEHLHNLINQVLDLSKLEAGHTTLNEAEFDPVALLDELKESFAPVAATRGLELAFHTGGALPRLIMGDALKLRQVLRNLVDNALKFTQRGRVSVRVETELTSGSPTSRLTFTVADTGPGIAPEELQHLFGAFVQAEAGRRAQEGTGLGLAISRGFVRLMGGEMAMESEPGKGTMVLFEIPVQVIEAPSVPTVKAAARKRVALAPGQPRYRLLLVDDDPDARRLLALLLGPLGFELKEAADGQQAIEVWREWCPHLIWMDLRMPVLGGDEAVGHIRRAAGAAGELRPVVVALTANDSQEKRTAALEAGFDDFLRKPFQEADLFALLEKYLGAHFIYREGAATAAKSHLNAGAFAALPEALRTQLDQALTQLDTGAVDRVIAAIGEHDPHLAGALTGLAGEFQYERILALLQAGEEIVASGPRPAREARPHT